MKKLVPKLMLKRSCVELVWYCICLNDRYARAAWIIAIMASFFNLKIKRQVCLTRSSTSWGSQFGNGWQQKKKVF
jgi:hypothetical protein